MLAGRAVDQLRVDANAISSFSDTAFQHVGDIELTRHLLHVRALSLETEGGVAGDDLEGGNLRKVGRDVLADAVAEIFLLRIAAHIDEGKDANGCSDNWRSRATGVDVGVLVAQIVNECRNASFDLAPCRA